MRIALVAVLGAVAVTGGSAVPHVAGCSVFPADNPWNRRVDRLPVAKASARIIASIGADTGLHPDFGSGVWDGGPIGIPVTVVDGRAAPRFRLRFEYADESDPGPYPIPAAVSAGLDKRLISGQFEC